MELRSVFVILGVVGACTPSTSDPGDARVADDAAESEDAGAIDSGPTCRIDSYDAWRGVAIHVMLDQSSSMGDAAGGGTRWSAFGSALRQFVGDDAFADVDVGLQYFGQPVAGGACTTALCSGDADCGPSACGPCMTFGGGIGSCSGFGADSCDAADYATADVAIAPAESVRAAVDDSLDAHAPSTGSLLSAPLAGALVHARAWAEGHPDADTVVVLVTDGEPQACDTDVSRIAAIAAEARAGSRPVATYLITIGDGLASLEPIATAGGTSAYPLASDTELTDQALDALRDLASRERAEACAFPLSAEASAASADERVVQYRLTASGDPVAIPRVATPIDCGAGDGFTFEGNDPTVLRLCPATCTTVRSSAGSALDVRTACPPP